MGNYREVQNALVEIFSSNPIVASDYLVTPERIYAMPSPELLQRFSAGIRTLLEEKGIALDQVDQFLHDADAFHAFTEKIASRKSHISRNVDAIAIDRMIRNIWFFVKNPERI